MAQGGTGRSTGVRARGILHSGRMVPDPTTAAAIEAHLRLVTRVTGQIERVNEQITAWEEWEANRELPPALKRLLPKPGIPLADLKELHRELVAKLAELVEGKGGPAH